MEREDRMPNMSYGEMIDKLAENGELEEVRAELRAEYEREFPGVSRETLDKLVDYVVSAVHADVPSRDMAFNLLRHVDAEAKKKEPWALELQLHGIRQLQATYRDAKAKGIDPVFAVASKRPHLSYTDAAKVVEEIKLLEGLA
jgi:hypothetical protein